MFSIIIPTFNRQDVLYRAINSVLNQSYTNWELIIIDDASTDSTESIIPKHPQIKYIKLKQNRGVSYSRNLGIEHSKFPWIAFLDSDDEWLPKKLAVCSSFIANNKQARLVHSDEIWVRKGVRVNPMKKHAKGGGEQFYRSLDLCVISPSAVVLEKQWLLGNTINGEVFKTDMRVCEDYDLWLRLTLNHDVHYIDEKLIIKYGGHEDQLSSSTPFMDYYRLKSCIQLYENFHELLDELPDKLDSLIKSIIKRYSLLMSGAKKHNNISMLSQLNEFNNCKIFKHLDRNQTVG